MNGAPSFDPEQEPWMDAADCATIDPELFHISKGGDVRPGKRICAGCPVRVECGEYAMRIEGGACGEYRAGIYGGLTGMERNRLYRAGWQPGDKLPEPTVGPRRIRCGVCGRDFVGIEAHMTRAHRDLRGAA